jgi:CRP-like cAMP-binding protein
MGTYNIEPQTFSTTPRIALSYPCDTGFGLTIRETKPAATNLLLKSLVSTSLGRLEPHVKRVPVSGGEFISRPDDSVEWVMFPETTALSELQILEDGRTIEVSLTGFEGAIGIPAVFWPAKSVNWIQASLPGVVYKIKRDVLQNLVSSDSWLNGLFQEALHSYIKQISQKVACNAHHSVEERFSTWLLLLNDRCPAQRLKLTQEQIARVLGVYRPSVTCIAQSLRDVGLIDYVRGNIVILDQDGLRERGCGCYFDLSAVDKKPLPRKAVAM